MDFVRERNKKLGEKVIKGLNKRRMEGHYVETKEEALKKVLELIEEGATVSWGGCQSGIEIGLFEKLKSGNYNVLDRAKGENREEMRKIELEAMNSDFYIMSSNGISADGVLVNIDGLGNRVASLIYGPKNVIVIAGINKVEADEELAIKRAKNSASPINNMRFNTNNPCTVDGICHSCLSDRCICSNIVITRFCNIPNRVKVVLVGEGLGF